MFERYTEAARRLLFFSRFAASELGSLSIETEHLLLGLVREGSGITTRLFATLGVSLERIRSDIESRATNVEKVATSVEIPFSSDTKRVLNFAAQEADALGHSYIGSEHLLLGMLRVERSVAATILSQHGVRLADVRRQIPELLAAPPAPLRPAVEPVFRDDLVQLVDRVRALLVDLRGAAGDNARFDEIVDGINFEVDTLRRRLTGK